MEEPKVSRTMTDNDFDSSTVDPRGPRGSEAVPLDAVVKCPACGGLTFRLTPPDDDAAPVGEITRVFYKCLRCGSEITNQRHG